MMRFLDVKTDFAFKKVFGSEESREILISFLNAIIYHGNPRQISEVTIVDPYNIPMIKGMKDTFVDVKAVLSDGSHVIIEMQVLNHPGFEKRVLCNAAKNYSVQLKKGEDYTLLNPVIALTLTDFTLFDSRSEHTSRFKLIEKESFIEYRDDIELIFVELPKFIKELSQLNDISDRWLWFIKHAGELDFVPHDLEAELRRAFEIINEANLSEPELEAQHKRKEFISVQRLALQDAKERGKREGREEGKEEVARNMRQAGVADEVITKVTGISQSKLDSLLR